MITKSRAEEYVLALLTVYLKYLIRYYLINVGCKFLPVLHVFQQGQPHGAVGEICRHGEEKHGSSKHDTLEVSFPDGADLETKARLIGALFLVNEVILRHRKSTL